MSSMGPQASHEDQYGPGTPMPSDQWQADLEAAAEPWRNPRPWLEGCTFEELAEMGYGTARKPGRPPLKAVTSTGPDPSADLPNSTAHHAYPDHYAA